VTSSGNGPGALCLPRPGGWSSRFCVLSANHDSSIRCSTLRGSTCAEQAIFWTRTQLEKVGDRIRGRVGRTTTCPLPRTSQDDWLFVHGSPRGPTNEYVFSEDTQNVKKMEKLFFSARARFVFPRTQARAGDFHTADHRFNRPAEPVTWVLTRRPNAKLISTVGSVGNHATVTHGVLRDRRTE